MTADQDTAPRTDGDRRVQWMGHGVNVGHAVYGDIHVHPAASASEPPGSRSAPAVRIPALRIAELLLALRRFSRACDRAAEALSAAGPDLT